MGAEMITAMAIIKPIYMNAATEFGQWYVQNWRMLEQYYAQLGGVKHDDEMAFIDFCKCQFDGQMHSHRDQELLDEVKDENARYEAEKNASHMNEWD
jgi:hypothetical protein